MEKVNCNLCGSKETRHLFTIQSLNLVKCKKCNLVYVNPRYTETELKSIYEENYFENPRFYEDGLGHYGYDQYFLDKENIQMNFEHRLNTIMKLTKSGRLLDIGCAAGFFLDLARKRGWKVSGIELSPDAIKFSKEKLKLSVKKGDIDKTKLSRSLYEAVTLFDVIEHLPNPYKALRKINASLKPGGIIVITTPDVGSIAARILGKNWLEFKRIREHIYFFSRETISKMLEKSGFEVVKIETTGRYFTLKSAFEFMSLQNKRFKPVSSAMKHLGLGGIKLHINPMYKMTAYARKA